MLYPRQTDLNIYLLRVAAVCSVVEGLQDPAGLFYVIGNLF